MLLKTFLYKCKPIILLVYQHIIDAHEKIPCEICGQMFGQRKMERHIQAKHTENDQKRFKCELCGKGFATKQRLKDHTNIHTGERPFMCKYCGASFANNGNCRMHERSMHLGHKR